MHYVKLVYRGCCADNDKDSILTSFTCFGIFVVDALSRPWHCRYRTLWKVEENRPREYLTKTGP